jgi:hypothetical protein
MSFGHAAAVMERHTVRARMWIAEDAGNVEDAKRLGRQLEALAPFRWERGASSDGAPVGLSEVAA